MENKESSGIHSLFQNEDSEKPLSNTFQETGQRSKTILSCFCCAISCAMVIAAMAIIMLVILSTVNLTAINSTKSQLEILMSQVTQLDTNISEIRAEFLALTDKQFEQLEAHVNILSDRYTSLRENTSLQTETLMSHVTQLATNISEIRAELLTLTHEQFRQLEAQIKSLSDNYTAVNTSLQNGPLQNKLNLNLEQRLQYVISALRKEQNITSNDLTMVVEQVGGIERNMESLKEHINSSVGLYEGCRTNKVRCTIQTQADQYWRLCSTPYVSKEVEGYITVDMRCHYTSLYRGHQVATALDRDPNNAQMRCRCSVTLPNTADHHPFRLPNNLFATCVLTATRCPMQQQLFTPYQ